MYAKILVPIDGSAASHRGYEEAVALARKMDSSLVLLHVIDAMPMPLEGVPSSVLEEMIEAQRKLGENLLERARTTAIGYGIAADTRLVDGRAERVADAIIAEALASRCELVVMGTHGRRGFSRVMIGSDAERVVRSCPVPVLLVRHPDAAKA
jgi:nucleotide-binding universal stress UspA family protein